MRRSLRCGFAALAEAHTLKAQKRLALPRVGTYRAVFDEWLSARSGLRHETTELAPDNGETTGGTG